MNLHINALPLFTMFNFETLNSIQQQTFSVLLFLVVFKTKQIPHFVEINFSFY